MAHQFTKGSKTKVLNHVHLTPKVMPKDRAGHPGLDGHLCSKTPTKQLSMATFEAYLATSSSLRPLT